MTSPLPPLHAPTLVNKPKRLIPASVSAFGSTSNCHRHHSSPSGPKPAATNTASTHLLLASLQNLDPPLKLSPSGGRNLSICKCHFIGQTVYYDISHSHNTPVQLVFAYSKLQFSNIINFNCMFAWFTVEPYHQKIFLMSVKNNFSQKFF